MQNKDIFIIQMEENHKRFRIFYLLKEEMEDLPNHLSEMLLLLKIGLGTSSSCGLSLCCRTTYVFSSGHICQSRSTIADIGLIGWQSVVDRLAASTDCWRVSIIIQQEVMVKRCKQKILRNVVKVDLVCTSFSPVW